MLRKMKTVFCLLMVLTVILSTTGSVYAVEYISEETPVIKPIGFADDILHSMRGVDVAAQLRTSLEAHGIAINDDTLIEIQTMQAHSRSSDVEVNVHSQAKNTMRNVTGLVITNVDGAKVSKMMIMSLDENNQPQEFVISDNSVSVRTSSNQYVNPFDDGSCYILTAVEYNQYQNPNTLNEEYYQPVSVLLYYIDNDGDRVDYVDMIYNCIGYEYTYPGFVSLTSGWEPYSHQIKVAAEAPMHQDIFMDLDHAYPAYRCPEEGEDVEYLASKKNGARYVNSVIWTGTGMGEHSVVWHIYDGTEYIWGGWDILPE